MTSGWRWRGWRRWRGGPSPLSPPGGAPPSPTTSRTEGGPALAAIARVILLCYYRDDRVMHSLGQEPRPPFPKGHTVEQGDWSLLDPVRARSRMYRPVD